MWFWSAWELILVTGSSAVRISWLTWRHDGTHGVSHGAEGWWVLKNEQHAVAFCVFQFQSCSYSCCLQDLVNILLNHYSWKRSLRSSTINPSPPCPLTASLSANTYWYTYNYGKQLVFLQEGAEEQQVLLPLFSQCCFVPPVKWLFSAPVGWMRLATSCGTWPSACSCPGWSLELPCLKA